MLENLPKYTGKYRNIDMNTYTAPDVLLIKIGWKMQHIWSRKGNQVTNRVERKANHIY